jgi:hypothetical protein
MTMADTKECKRCGEDFVPTIIRGLAFTTAEDTCPAGGGAGHWASRLPAGDPIVEIPADTVEAEATR